MFLLLIFALCIPLQPLYLPAFLCFCVQCVLTSSVRWCVRVIPFRSRRYVVIRALHHFLDIKNAAHWILVVFSSLPFSVMFIVHLVCILVLCSASCNQSYSSIPYGVAHSHMASTGGTQKNSHILITKSCAYIFFIRLPHILHTLQFEWEKLHDI